MTEPIPLLDDAQVCRHCGRPVVRETGEAACAASRAGLLTAARRAGWPPARLPDTHVFTSGRNVWEAYAKSPALTEWKIRDVMASLDALGRLYDERPELRAEDE